MWDLVTEFLFLEGRTVERLIKVTFREFVSAEFMFLKKMLIYFLFVSDFRTVAIRPFNNAGSLQSGLESHFLIDAAIAEIIFGVLHDWLLRM